MEIKQVITLSDSDKELLRTPLPVCPCDIKCPFPEQRWQCCGCPDHRKYEAVVQPYKDAGVFEYALVLGKIRKLRGQILSLEDSIKSIYESLPTEIREFVDGLSDV